MPSLSLSLSPTIASRTLLTPYHAKKKATFSPCFEKTPPVSSFFITDTKRLRCSARAMQRGARRGASSRRPDGRRLVENTGTVRGRTKPIAKKVGRVHSGNMPNNNPKKKAFPSTATGRHWPAVCPRSCTPRPAAWVEPLVQPLRLRGAKEALRDQAVHVRQNITNTVLSCPLAWWLGKTIVRTKKKRTPGLRPSGNRLVHFVRESRLTTGLVG